MAQLRVVTTAALLSLSSLGLLPGTLGETQEEICATASKDFALWPEDHAHPEHPSLYTPPEDLKSMPFVILSAPRSASNSLVNVLNEHPMLQVLPEVFEQEYIPGHLGKAGWTAEWRDANRTAFMQALFELEEPPAKPSVLARGFKIFRKHLTEDELVRLTAPKHVLKIVLRRQDTLSQYVSGLRAGDVGFFGRVQKASTDVAEAFADERVGVCVEAYENYLASLNSWFDWCLDQARDHPESWLFISTEQLTSDPYTIQSVYAALKVNPGGALDYEPYTTDVLEDKVTNYDDIKDIPRDVENKW